MFNDLALPQLDVEAENRFRVSPSKLRMFMEDQAQYYFRYIENRQGVQSAALFEGSTYHKGIEYALNIKKESGSLPPLPQILVYLEQYWNQYNPTTLTGLKLDNDKFIRVAQMFEVLYPVLKTIIPKQLETHVLRSVENQPYDIHGYIDCVATAKRGGEKFNPDTDSIIDFKSRAQSPVVINKQWKITSFEKLQLTLYAWCLTKGAEPVSAEIIYLVKTKVPKVIRVPYTITPEQMKNKVKTVSSVVESMQTGKYIPNYGYWKCRPDKCEFYNECHAKF